MAMLTFQQLYAGRYYTDSTTVCRIPPVANLSATIAVAGIRDDFVVCLEVSFTSWAGRRYKLSIPMDQIVFNFLDEEILHIEKLAKNDMRALVLQVFTSLNTWERVNITWSSRIEDQPPESFSKDPMDILEVTRCDLILRHCKESRKEQILFLKGMAKLGASITQGVLDRSVASGSGPETVGHLQDQSRSISSGLANLRMEMAPPGKNIASRDGKAFGGWNDGWLRSSAKPQGFHEQMSIENDKISTTATDGFGSQNWSSRSKRSGKSRIDLPVPRNPFRGYEEPQSHKASVTKSQRRRQRQRRHSYSYDVPSGLLEARDTRFEFNTDIEMNPAEKGGSWGDHLSKHPSRANLNPDVDEEPTKTKLSWRDIQAKQAARDRMQQQDHPNWIKNSNLVPVTPRYRRQEPNPQIKTEKDAAEMSNFSIRPGTDPIIKLEQRSPSPIRRSLSPGAYSSNMGVRSRYARGPRSSPPPGRRTG